jgi:integrase
MPTIKLILQQPYTAIQQDKGTKNKKLNPRETRLYCFLILDRERVIKIKTEFVILPQEWDFSIQGKKERLAGSIEFNKKLKKLRDDIWDKYQDTIADFPDISFDHLSRKMKEYGKTREIPVSNNAKDVAAVLDEYIESLKGQVSENTIKKFTTLKNSLEQFGKGNKKYQSLTFSMIDHSFMESYRKFLRTQEPRGRQKSRPEDLQKGLLIDTQTKYIKCLKCFCKYAEERGYNKYPHYRCFECVTKADQKRKKSDYDIVTLTLSELRQFYSHDFSKSPHLDRVRDLFCFGCFTGQRWGDFSNFDKSQLQDDVWTFIADKTKQEIQIDLTGYAAPALEILKKYDYQLPKITQQKFNDYLKDAALEAGINEPTKIIRYVGVKEIIIMKPKSQFLSSHSARRTCVSILLNDFNLNVVHVMGITGHTDIKTLQKYINKDREARRKAISNTKSITELMTVKKSEAV